MGKQPIQLWFHSRNMNAHKCMTIRLFECMSFIIYPLAFTLLPFRVLQHLPSSSYLRQTSSSSVHEPSVLRQSYPSAPPSPSLHLPALLFPPRLPPPDSEHTADYFPSSYLHSISGRVCAMLEVEPRVWVVSTTLVV